MVEPINKLNYESLPLAENDTWGVLSKIDSDFKDVSHVTADLLKPTLNYFKTRRCQNNDC